MTQPKCPICSKPSEQKFNPFCSKRCADVDLSRWLKGSYAIPGRPAEDEGEVVSSDPDSGQKSVQKQQQDDPD
jgi:endogenous inhibitor of DNA gyrase (YacG/DUF329 family)